MNMSHDDMFVLVLRLYSLSIVVRVICACVRTGRAGVGGKETSQWAERPFLFIIHDSH